MSGEKEIQIKRMMQQFDHEISELNSTAISEIAGDIHNDFKTICFQEINPDHPRHLDPRTNIFLSWLKVAEGRMVVFFS